MNDACENDDKHSELSHRSTQSSILDADFAEDLRAEIHRMEKLVPSQNCTRPSCAHRHQRLQMLKKMSTVSDSVAVSRNDKMVDLEQVTRSSSLQDLRSPSPGAYSCAAVYCPVLVSRV